MKPRDTIWNRYEGGLEGVGLRKDGESPTLEPLEYRPPGPDTSWMSRTFKLHKKPRIKLLFQSPTIYETDIGEWISRLGMAKNPGFTLGSKWACRAWDGRLQIGNKPPRILGHPSITFNSNTMKNIKVHLEDVTPGPQQGTVYWHATYELPLITQPKDRILGKASLGSRDLSVEEKMFINPLERLSDKLKPDERGSEEDVMKREYRPFRLPCVPPDDPTTHTFVLSVRTQDEFYPDGRTPYGDLEGFGGVMLPDANIGFQVVRMPLIATSKDGLNVYPQTCRWKSPKGTCARGGPPYNDAYERFLDGTGDPFFDERLYTNGRNYYEYIYSQRARMSDGGKFFPRYFAKSMSEIPSVPEYIQEKIGPEAQPGGWSFFL